MGVRIGCGISTEHDARVAATQAAHSALQDLKGAPCDIVFLFACGSHLAAPEAILEVVHEILRPENLVGCCAAGVIGGYREIENGSGITVWAASLGDGHAVAFHGDIEPFGHSAALLGVPELSHAAGTIMLVDPFTFPVEAALQYIAKLNSNNGSLGLVGGVASARTEEGTSALFLDERVIDSGAVGIRFEGIDMFTHVAQGATPIGPELTITAASDGMITELAGRPALTKLRDVVESLSTRDRKHLESGVLLGVVIDPNKPDYLLGDFVVRGISYVDEQSGEIGIGTTVSPGQVVCIHTRDPKVAHKELMHTLVTARQSLGDRNPAGVLTFACNGRGADMFGVSNHDARTIPKFFGGVPTGGFFAAGEITPAKGRLVVNSFTATIAVFAA